MDAKGSLFISFSVLFLFSFFQRSAAHPIDSLSPAKELASMETLLERLEEKISLMEDLQNNPDLDEPESQRESLSEFPDGSNSQRLEMGVESVPFHSDRSSLLKRMRGLQTTKSMRESGCFGRRLDRIGSVSGMGCKGTRRI
ncbi:natriuretic peptides A-like [Rhineura floridana]|uniref:natriuretic peptides A-like n=1 Tax=Rhineura floridana TaxID=261503 RepID=UPI002AC80521|nr:natriuretic peptides A-like [Rhineura floridana]